MVSEEADNGDSKPPLLGANITLSQFVENMGLHYEDYGVPRIGGRILGLLLLADRPIDSDEIVDVLQVSRSSVSTNLRTLLMTGLADRVSLPGERSDYYVFSTDAWEKALEMRLDSILSLRDTAEEGMAGLAENHPARERLAEIIKWVDIVEEGYEKMLESWQAFKEVSA